MRQDDALLRAFVAAECRLLLDLGVDPNAVERLRGALTYVLREGPALGEAAEPQMRALLDGLEREFDAVNYGDSGPRWAAILGGLFRVLGGGLLVTTNAIVGAGLAPVSGGLSVGGAALSAVAGGELVSRGLDSALAA